jgi:hypothetical protein
VEVVTGEEKVIYQTQLSLSFMNDMWCLGFRL